MIDKPLTSAEWSQMQELRQRFLTPPDQSLDYWQSQQILDLYDRTFARRILWKWQGILNEAAVPLSAILSRTQNIVDLGCGSGVAIEALLGFDASVRDKSLLLIDRSEIALRYATQKLKGMGVVKIQGKKRWDEPLPAGDTLVIASHFVNELAISELPRLSQSLEKSLAFFFVEPGTKASSEKLGWLRHSLLDSFSPLAPCPQEGACPLAQGDKGDWCHQYFDPPSLVFQSAFWAEFSRKLQIDLRALPSSWLLAARKNIANLSSDPGVLRILGRAKFTKSAALLVTCENDALLHQREISKSKHKTLFRALRKQSQAGLMRADFAEPAAFPSTGDE
jgi:ribosomal protein RSM22 (predicted rRNA methylase)